MCIWGRSSSPAARRYSRVAAGDISLSGALSRACATLRSSPADSSESLLLALPDCTPRRLLWLLPLAVGLPLLMIWWGSRTLFRRSAEPSRRWATVAVLLGGLAGTTALAATWSATTTVADHLGRSYAFRALYLPLDRLLVLDASVGSTSLLVHAALLSLFIGIGVAY